MMCSVAEDELPAETMIAAPKVSLKDATCRRCLTKKGQALLRKTDPYCCDCFMKYAVHKFRSTIGKARAIKPNENVLLAYSGGLSSGCMVELVKQGLQDSSTQKMKLVFKPTLFHIDEGAVLNLSEEKRMEATHFILERAKKSGFDIYVCGLEYCLVQDAHQVELQLNSYQVLPSKYGNQLQRLFASVQSLTAKEDLLARLKQRLIMLLAVQLNHGKVFLGPNATRLSGQLLCAVGQGRGSQIAQEIGFTDLRSGVAVLRPMREFVDKEVAYLAHFLQVDSVSLPTLSSKLASIASIGRLTEEFVVTLQANFPATISTLFRIGDKLKSNGVNNTSENMEDFYCLLCLSVIEEESICSASNARRVSRIVSRNGPKGLKANSTQFTTTVQNSVTCNSVCTTKGNTCCTTAFENYVENWSTILCYGCRITMEEVKEQELMPISIQDELQQRTRRQLMRQSVEQFLL